MSKGRTELCSRYIKIFVVVSCYWTISLLTVFLNKRLLSSKEVGLEAPISITWFQCLVTYLICCVLSKTGGIYKVLTFPKGTPWSLETFKKVIPLSILFTLMISVNNLSLKNVGVPFFYIGRSLSTVFNVVLTWLILKQTTSYKCVGCCAFIVVGFCIGVSQEKVLGTLHIMGTIYRIIGAFITSVYAIYIKKVLPHVKEEVWMISYCNNAYSLFLMLPIMLLDGELKVLWNFNNYGSWFFWLQMVVGGIFGFSIGFFIALQIKVTSPLTHNVSGSAKGCFQSVIATQWYQESKNVLWWTSNTVVLISSALYAWFKHLEMVENDKPPVSTDNENQEPERPEETQLNPVQNGTIV